jgi:hypothetical protein
MELAPARADLWIGAMMARPTAIQSFTMKVLYAALGIDPINRTVDEYQQIKARIPKSLKVVHGLIIDYLKAHKVTDFSCAEFCRFDVGHKIIHYESYPTKISRETVRQALIVHGWR